MHKIPAFYHPTTLTLVDDDMDFLISLSLALGNHFRCHTFTSPDEAEQFLRSIYPQQLVDDTSYFSIAERAYAELPVDVQINAIYRQVFNQQRFDKHYLLIVDHDMPNRNGLELARTLKAILPIKIILLTGEADRETAINAFNAKEIDRFLLKSDPDYRHKLIRHVHELQRDYFIEQSIGILKSLASQEVHPLQEPAFIELFESCCAEHHCVEYYLLDESCSFLFLDEQGHETWLILRSALDMQSYYELAEDEEPAVSDDILRSLKDCSKLVFFKQGTEGIPPVDEWLFIEAKPLAGTDMYYGFLHGKQGYAQPENIYSYSEFLNND